MLIGTNLQVPEGAKQAPQPLIDCRPVTQTPTVNSCWGVSLQRWRGSWAPVHPIIVSLAHFFEIIQPLNTLDN